MTNVRFLSFRTRESYLSMQEYLIHACHTESSSSAPEQLIPASVPEVRASRRYSRTLNFTEYPLNVLLMRRCIRPLHLLLASFTVLRLSTARKHPSLYFASSSHVFPHSSKSFLPLSFYSSLPSVCALLLFPYSSWIPKLQPTCSVGQNNLGKSFHFSPFMDCHLKPSNYILC